MKKDPKTSCNWTVGDTNDGQLPYVRVMRTRAVWEINQAQTWKHDGLQWFQKTVRLNGWDSILVMSAEDQTGVLLDETLCYWCHVYLKPSGSAPSDPKMNRYDDTTFRSHDPTGSVSSDERSEWCSTAVFFVYTCYFSWESSWNVFFFHRSLDLCRHVVPSQRPGGSSGGDSNQGQQGGAGVWVLMQTHSQNAGCFSVEMTALPARRQWWRLNRSLSQTYGQGADPYPVDLMDLSWSV